MCNVRLYRRRVMSAIGACRTAAVDLPVAIQSDIASTHGRVISTSHVSTKRADDYSESRTRPRAISHSVRHNRRSWLPEAQLLAGGHVDMITF